VATDAVFSMDGDAADLPALVDLCERQGALLLIDEAHATGLLGADGAGLAQLQGVRGRVPLVMGTLGKAVGAFGAFVCCDTVLRDHLLNTARGFIFSTALPPPVLGAALEGIRIARAEPWRRERALALADRLRTPWDSPVNLRLSCRSRWGPTLRPCASPRRSSFKASTFGPCGLPRCPKARPDSGSPRAPTWRTPRSRASLRLS